MASACSTLALGLAQEHLPAQVFGFKGRPPGAYIGHQRPDERAELLRVLKLAQQAGQIEGEQVAAHRGPYWASSSVA